MAQSRGQLVELQFPQDAADWQWFLYLHKHAVGVANEVISNTDRHINRCADRLGR